MSQNKHFREVWCRQTLERAVELFHAARQHPDSEAEELQRIAVRCANSAFQERAHLILWSKDETARRYGELCYDRFQDEIQKAILEPEPEEELVC